MGNSIPKINALRGMADTLPDESWKWQAVESIARQVASLYHFSEIRTPILEDTALFHRGVGETTDVVGKEMFTFKDRGDDSNTLRPEGTAGVVRAAIENNLIAQEGSRAKVFYIGPNFRYEAPQRGRLRQHHQFGVEAFGIAEPDQDAECILLQMDFYRRCGVRDLQLRLNSLGNKESKARYRDALVAFLTPKASQLSPDSQRRLSENPLRILDSKDEKDKKACQGAPAAADSLTDQSKNHFARVQELLAGQKVPFVVDGTLVRGFDYYTDTLWEVTASAPDLGSQNALGGGGRYDNLVESLGGRPTPGVGFGSGLERLLIALDSQKVVIPDPRPPLVWIVALGKAAEESCWGLLALLRSGGICADMDFSHRSAKAQFKLADREKAKFSLVIGDNELAKNEIIVKDLTTGQQSAVPQHKIADYLKAELSR